MLSKEEYKKTVVRMWDSVREDDRKGECSCVGITCSKCPLNGYCPVAIEDALDAIEVVEKWAEEHPIKTNGQVLEDTLKEKFGDIFDVSKFSCSMFKDRHCDVDCVDCEFFKFWNSEYKEVK